MENTTMNTTIKLRVTAIAVLFAFCTMMMIPTGAMAATHQSATTYVQGTSAAGDVLNGVLKVTSFANQGGQLVAQGLLNGTLTSASGVVTPIVNLPVTAPVSGVSGS